MKKSFLHTGCLLMASCIYLCTIPTHSFTPNTYHFFTSRPLSFVSNHRFEITSHINLDPTNNSHDYNIKSHKSYKSSKPSKTNKHKSSKINILGHIQAQVAATFLFTLSTMTGIGILSLEPHTSMAYSDVGGSRLVGSLSGSGLVFKDTLNIESFDDPKVQGVTVYISNFQRPLTERLSKDFFSDPSTAGLGCAKTSKDVKIADNIGTGTQGEEVFEESKSLLFKTLRVQRFYDKEKNTIVYVTFNTRIDKNSDSNKSRFASSICAVNLD